MNAFAIGYIGTLSEKSMKTLRSKDLSKHQNACTACPDWGGGGGGNRTRVRRTSASKDYVCIRSVNFRERNVRIGRSARPLSPWFRLKIRRLNPSLSRCVTPRPVFTGKNGETWLSKQPALTDYQQLYLISTIFTSRGQLDTPLQPLDPRRIQCTPSII